MRWKCPACGSTKLKVVVSAWAELWQFEDDHFETGLAEDHEWNGDSLAQCQRCGKIDDSFFFRVPPDATPSQDPA
jgi:hypothetical protein